MHLYKYIAPQLTSVLENGMIRFTQAECLNDPCEMAPYIASLIEAETLNSMVTDAVGSIDVEKLALEQFEECWRNLPRLAKRKTTKELAWREALKIVRQGSWGALHETRQVMIEGFNQASPSMLANAKKMFREKVGVLCLSEVWDSQTMWSYYADSHKGFVIEFDAEHPFFSAPDQDASEMLSVQKVIYTDGRPQLQAFIDEKNSLDAFFFRKGTEWSKEREWRMVRHVERCDHCLTVSGSEVYLFNYSPEAVRSVIVGARASEDTVQTLTKLLEEDTKLQHVFLKRAVIPEDSYGMTLETLRSPKV